MLEPVGFPLTQRGTVTDAIVSQLIRLITQGRFKPGDALPSEAELAKQFHVARGTLREAIKALEVVGLVRVDRGIGTFVAERSGFFIRPMTLGLENWPEVESLIEAREIIEVELAALAAIRAQDEERRSIESYLMKMRSSSEPERVAEFLEADICFHFAIATAAHNPILGQCLTLIRNLMEKWIPLTQRQPGVIEKTLREHGQIFGAIQRRRPVAAQKAMRNHLEGFREVLLRLRQNEPVKQPKIPAKMAS